MTNRKSSDLYRLQTNVGNMDPDANSISARRPRQFLETYGDHGSQSGMATKKRLRLIVQGFKERVRKSAKDSRHLAKQALREAGVQVGMVASRKLYKLAKRIEDKAMSIQSKSR